MDQIRGRAAGVLFVTPDRTALLLRRAAGDMRGYWSIPGGLIEYGESAWDAARRETKEEIGVDPPINATLVSHRKPKYTTFVAGVAKAFIPSLNYEHDDWAWFSIDSLPRRLHPGLLDVLDSTLEDEVR